jgi:hypothetical protein
MNIAVEVILHNIAYSLTDGTLAELLKRSGDGVIAPTNITDQGPQQHGTTFRAMRLDQRSLMLLLQAYSSTDAGLQSKREILTNLFAPSESTPLTLRFTLPGGAVRQIEGYVQSFEPGEEVLHYQQYVARLLCPKNTFYDPTGVQVTYGVGGGAGTGFAVPLTVPVAVGTSVLVGAKAVVNRGNFRAEPVITIVGPITSPVITNTTLNRKIDLTGVILGAGETITINTAFDQKTIVHSSGTNLIPNLSSDSDLGGWYLASARDVPGGTNNVSVSGTSITASTEVYVAFNEQYVSL